MLFYFRLLLPSLVRAPLIKYSFLIWLFPSLGFAQTTLYHNTFWSRMTLTDTLNGKFRWDLTGQYRTQNTKRGSLNLFDVYQFHSYAFWLNYIPNPHLRLALLPISYFSTKPFVAKPADIAARAVREYRWAIRLDQQQNFRYFNLVNRYGLEYRFRDVNVAHVYVPNWRLRYMIRFVKPLNVRGVKNKLTLFLQNEVMAQFGRAVKGNSNVFDQNRTLVGANFDLVKNVRLELAYQKIIQQRRSVYQFDDQNILLVALTFDHVFSQFGKKKSDSAMNK